MCMWNVRILLWPIVKKMQHTCQAKFCQMSISNIIGERAIYPVIQSVRCARKRAGRRSVCRDIAASGAE